MNESKATRYQRLRRRTSVAAVAAGGILLLVLVTTPLSRALADWSVGVGRGASGTLAPVVALLAFVTSTVLLWEAVALPAVLYLALSVDKRYGRAGIEVEDVLRAHAESAIVGLVGALTVAGVVELAVRAGGDLWWVLATVAISMFVAALHRAAPTVIVLTGVARPIERVALAERLRALADRARVSVAGIDEWHGEDGSTARIAGLGASRRIFVSAGVLHDWSDEEIEVVVAHELAHHAHRDLWWALAMDAAVIGIGLWLATVVFHAAGASLGYVTLRDPAALPLVALVGGLVWVAATPARHALSRRHERQADRFALDLTGRGDAFAAAVRRLGALHLAEEQPTSLTRWWYHRHPTVAERLAFAAAHARPSPPDRSSARAR